MSYRFRLQVRTLAFRQYLDTALDDSVLLDLHARRREALAP
jgi:hypothetical protein